MAKHNGQKSDLQNPTQKNKDRAPGTSIKPVVNSGTQEGLSVPAPLVTPVMLLLHNTSEHHVRWKSWRKPLFVNKYK
jgi:hypothetical protein